jgi:uncharacterized damage-inducible protein DinB
METLEYLRRQFVYDSWANREVYNAMSGNANLSNRPLQLLSHILSAERLWLERIRQQPQSLPVWPDLTLAQCGLQIDDMTILWKEYFERLSPERLAAQITYKNTKGEPWTSTVQDILTHVLLHSSYHRGQIAAQTRAEDVQPAYTDFIHAVRQGLIE